MKILRSVKCSLRFSTDSKRARLRSILAEYGRVTNLFIDHFWQSCPRKSELLKPLVDLPQTWLSARLRKVAAREAIDMIRSARKRDGEKARKPHHRGRRMHISSTIATLQPARKTCEFDAWLHLASIGQNIILDLPVRFHRAYNKWDARGKRLNSYVLTERSVQLCFEVETGPKPQEGFAVGVDTGILSLATLSTGEKLGQDIAGLIEAIKRCSWASKRQKRLRRALRQRMAEVSRDLCRQEGVSLLVVEALRRLNHRSKATRRVAKNMRRSLGAWAYRAWLDRLSMTADENRVRFRSVSPAYTSQRCHACGHTERGNRSGRDFLCRSCAHADDADVNAAKNILERCLSGPYGAGFKPLKSS